ncbi:uncharacterized protein LOC131801980 isoform X1 [Musca domestica]|uniref:Uncharacterized protein LOC131801980 isoform X1 n=2 Tax=Musca domestica TaxID=7370 RepID=A0ABM3UUH7_MUSDO|nr:uncharacterized protein LOC131801980 isoform X1 [Musca domestica]
MCFVVLLHNKLYAKKTFGMLFQRNLTETINDLVKTVQQNSEAIMSAFAEINVVTTKLVRQETSISTATNDFPISSEIMLQKMEEKITCDNRDIYVSTMNKLWRNCVGKNRENILDSKVKMDYNVDGTHGKRSLRKYKIFYKALIDSIETLPSLGEKNAEQLLRQAMQLCKKKQFRKNSENKKIELESTENIDVN